MGLLRPVQAQAAAPTASRAVLPVREITVFKDGHAFVLHSGQMATDANGNVQLSRLPTPVLGTFWPYCADKNATLTAVTASASKTPVEHPALSVSELLEANVGARITVTQTDGRKYDAQIVATPRAVLDTSETPSGAMGGLPGGFGRGFVIRNPLPLLQIDRSFPPTIVLLKTQEGESAVPLSLIRSVTFKGAYRRTLAIQEMRDHLSLKLAWKKGKPARTASVGMVYLQKGIRWIPSYRVSMDGKGHAVVSLQATLLNEMIDLNDVTCHLVVGVPTFWFKDTPDPISLQQTFPQLSRFFQADSQTAYAFSNSIASQAAGGGLGSGGGGGSFGGRGGAGAAPIGAGMDGIGTDRSEDLFLYTVRHITLKKGQNMTLPVTQFTLDYKDVYRLEVPITPPFSVAPNGSQPDQELARLARTPRAQHRIRLMNKSAYPITTAPVLITSGDRVIAQTLTSYTSIGATLDLALTTATNVGVKRTETETKRAPDAQMWQGDHLTRHDLSGALAVTNYDDKPIDLEIVRYVPGRVDTTNQDGVFGAVSPLGDDSDEATGSEARPAWWGGYSWPAYWQIFNGLNRVTWNARIAPKANVDFTYVWHYFSQQ